MSSSVSGIGTSRFIFFKYLNLFLLWSTEDKPILLLLLLLRLFLFKSLFRIYDIRQLLLLSANNMYHQVAAMEISVKAKTKAK